MEFKSHTSEFWDRRYGGDSYAYGTEPNEFLRRCAPLFAPSQRALVPADGEGRNGVWLARQGLNVTTIDLSAEGVAKARRLATTAGVELNAIQADLMTWDWPEGVFDVVASIYLNLGPKERPSVHRRMMLSLRPGGVLVLEALTPAQLRVGSFGPQDAAMLYDPELVAADFAALGHFEHWEEREIEIQEGECHSGRAAVLRGVVRRHSD